MRKGLPFSVINALYVDTLRIIVSYVKPLTEKQPVKGDAYYVSPWRNRKKGTVDVRNLFTVYTLLIIDN